MDGGGRGGGGEQLGPVRKVKAQYLPGLVPLGAPSASWSLAGQSWSKLCVDSGH